MDPAHFLYIYVSLGVAVAALAGLTASRLRVLHRALADKAQAQSRDLPPLVEGYFRWMSRSLAGSAGVFLVLALTDGVLSRTSTPELVLRGLGFVAATCLLAGGSLLVMAGTVDMRLRLAAGWHRGLMLAGGFAGTALAAAVMVQLVQQGRLWI